jgi:hypothetical protein
VPVSAPPNIDDRARRANVLGRVAGHEQEIGAQTRRNRPRSSRPKCRADTRGRSERLLIAETRPNQQFQFPVHTGAVRGRERRGAGAGQNRHSRPAQCTGRRDRTRGNRTVHFAVSGGPHDLEISTLGPLTDRPALHVRHSRPIGSGESAVRPITPA